MEKKFTSHEIATDEEVKLFLNFVRHTKNLNFTYPSADVRETTLLHHPSKSRDAFFNQKSEFENDLNHVKSYKFELRGPNPNLISGFEAENDLYSNRGDKVFVKPYDLNYHPAPDSHIFNEYEERYFKQYHLQPNYIYLKDNMKNCRRDTFYSRPSFSYNQNFIKPKIRCLNSRNYFKHNIHENNMRSRQIVENAKMYYSYYIKKNENKGCSRFLTSRTDDFTTKNDSPTIGKSILEDQKCKNRNIINANDDSILFTSKSQRSSDEFSSENQRLFKFDSVPSRDSSEKHLIEDLNDKEIENNPKEGKQGSNNNQNCLKKKNFSNENINICEGKSIENSCSDSNDSFRIEASSICAERRKPTEKGSFSPILKNKNTFLDSEVVFEVEVNPSKSNLNKQSDGSMSDNQIVKARRRSKNLEI